MEQHTTSLQWKISFKMFIQHYQFKFLYILVHFCTNLALLNANKIQIIWNGISAVIHIITTQFS